jgi:stage III sporulation protein AF
MINFLSSWVKNLSLALIIVSILEMILPNNKTKKYVRTVMGLYILFSIISPFIENSSKINLNNIDLDSYTENTKTASSKVEEVDQTSMDNRINEIYKEELQKDITQKIEEKGYKVETCKVVAYISEKNSEIEKITIKINGKINEENDNDVKNNTIENKIVTEIQKIQKVNIGVGENKENKEEETNITKTDIKIIKDFLIKEYGVSEKCLKIS